MDDPAKRLPSSLADREGCPGWGPGSPRSLCWRPQASTPIALPEGGSRVSWGLQAELREEATIQTCQARAPHHLPPATRENLA